MVMTLGISITFYFRSTFRDGMAHNEARLLVSCCDILGFFFFFFQETIWYYYYQLSKSRWTGSRVWSLEILFLYTDRVVVRALGWFQVAYQRLGKSKTGGGGCERDKKKKTGGCRVWKDEERVGLMGCIAYSGKHGNTIMSGV
ncbi:hypothetical protein QR685DRAFT_570484 [Neurospora intermedia]|uniref:Uncharacterized protein n=1 Tax=Neurospora intermedia TaxID=5142 RepID=A0ABR3DGC2_NEUIN